MKFIEKLDLELKEGKIIPLVHELFLQMYESYSNSIAKEGMDMAEHEPLFFTYLDLIKEQLQNPYRFESYHKKEEPYATFAIDLFYHLVDRKKSKLFHGENLKKIEEQIKRGENVVFLANHQTEVDPQMLYTMLEKEHPQLGRDLIFIAGDRVVSDPAAVPLSRGTNLLCIYSKRHIDNPPEKKQEKLAQNQRTMKRMRELLAEGGKAIYVAPSGGRDRKNAQGVLEVAPFDGASIEMFRLQAHKAKTPTHFYPLAMHTHDVLPPPAEIKTELGEERRPTFATIHLAFGEEIDMDNFPGCDIDDRHEKREARARHIWGLVNSYYSEFPK